MSKKTAQENQQKKQQAQQAQQQNQQTVQSGLTGMQRAAANNYTGSVAPLTYEQFQQARQNGVSMDDLNIFRGIDGSHDLTYDEFRVARQLGVSTDALSQYRDQVNARKKAEQQAMAPRGAGQGAVVGASPVWQRPASRAGQGLIAGAQGGDLLHAARQGAAEEASKAHGSALLNYLGSVARLAQDAQGGIMRSPAEQQAQNQRIIDAAGQVRQTRDTLNRERQPIEWQGRQELIDEYKRLRAALTYTDPEYMTPQEYDQQVKTYSRIQEIERQLTEGDRRAGNGDRVYSFGHGAENVGKALAGGYFEGFVDYGALKLNQALSGVNTNEYAGWATDPMSAEQIGFEHDQSKMGDYAAIQNAANALQQAGGDLRASGQEALGRVMEGKSKAAQFGWNLAINMGQMMLDRIVGAVTGVDPLVPMYIRSAGSSARDAMEEGYGVDQQAVYGTVKGLIEVLTEKAGGLGSGVFYGKGWTDALADELVTRLAKNPAAMMGLRVLFAGFEEGAEEGASYGLDPLARWLAGMKQPGLNMADAMEDMLSGFAMGVLGAGGQALTGGYNAENYQTMLEQASRQATQDWYQSGGWLADRETRQEAGREAVYGQDYVERMQQLQAAMQPEQEYYGDETAPQPAAQTAPLVQGSQEQAGQTVQQSAQQAAPAQAQTAAQEEEAKKQARTETMTGILQREATRQGMRGPGTQVLGEMAKVYEPGTSGQAYARAALEAYQLGQQGHSFEEARQLSESAATLSAEQFRTAWGLGSGVKASEMGSLTQRDTTWEEAQQSVTVNGESARILGVEAGKVLIQQNGETRAVAMDSVEGLPESYRRLVAAATHTQGGDAMLRAYQPGQNVNAYVKAWNRAYSLYGAQTDMTVEKARKAGKNSLKALTDEQLRQALSQGRETAPEKGTATRSELTGQVQYWQGGELDGVEYDAVTEAEARELLGDGEMRLLTDVLSSVVNVTLYKSKADASGRFSGAQGMFFRDGRIYLDVNAGLTDAKTGQRTIVLAAAHELTHFIRAYNEEGYRALRSFIANELTEQGLSIDSLVNQKIARASSKLSLDDAMEEVIADACETMLTDEARLRAFAEAEPKAAKTIGDWLRDFAAKLRARLKNLKAVHTEAIAMQERIDELSELWYKALSQAREAASASEAIDRLSEGGQEIVEGLGRDAEIQVDENGDMDLAKSEDGNTLAFSMRTYDETGKAKLIKALQENGHTQEEIDAVTETIEATGEFLEKLARQFSDSHGYDNLMNNLWANISTNVKTGKQVISTLVNNGDYPVNLDLQLICKKRVAYMRMLTRLIDDGVFEKVDFKGSAIADLNAILRDGGFETACLGCFVEARRLQLQAWAETIVEEWNAAVDKRNPQAGDFNFAKGGNAMNQMEIAGLITELENAGKKNDKGNLNLGKGAVAEKMGRLLDKVPSLAQHLTVADLLTPQGISTLRSYDQNLFSLVKQRYGAASPKIVQDFNAYNSEIADLSFKFVKSMIGESVKGSGKYTSQARKTLKQEKGESKAAYDRRVETEAMRRYLYDIGGARIQSFSDFMIENVFDYLQIIADLSAREFPLHGYSKEAVFLRLFGMTGGKFNGSLIAHVEASMGKENAGLLPAEEASNGRGIVVEVDGEKYAICFDDYARHVATGSFIQSIGMKDIVALQLDPRYSKHVGSITIGVSDKQIRAMLDSPYFRMVIPYHASGMLPEFARLVGVSSYNDYTDYQTTKVNKCFDLDGNPVEGFWKADGKRVEIDTHFDYNEAVQRLGDARAAANEYLEWCRQRHAVYDGKKKVGYATFTPKFSDSPYGTDFTTHENYYKLLEDFTSYDAIGEASALQGAVTMTLPSEATRLTAEQMEAYRQALRDTGLFTEKEIEKFAKKADMTFRELIAEEIGNRAEYGSRQAKVWDETVDKAEKMLLEKYGREKAAPAGGTETENGEGAKHADRDYSYDALVKKPPVAVTEFDAQLVPTKAAKRGTVVDTQALSKAALSGAEVLHNPPAGDQRYVFIPDIGENVQVNRGSVSHGTTSTIRNNSTMRTAEVSFALPNILKNSIAVNELSPRTADDGEYSYVLFGVAMRSDGNAYLVRSTVNHFADNRSIVQEVEIYDLLKGIKAKTIDAGTLRSLTAKTAASRSATNASIELSVADLLGFVKDEYPGFLPESARKHYGLPTNAGVQGLRHSDRDAAESAAPVRQEYSSAATSINANKLPVLYTNKHAVFTPGGVNIDVGGGRFDNVTEYLAGKGVTNMIFDPYNRSDEFNRRALDYLISGQQADTATCSNCLNVIREAPARANVILECAKAIKPDGKAYFTVYEGDGSGVGKVTKSGWQENRKTADYVQEIKQYFDIVVRRGNLITAERPRPNLPKAAWETSPGNATMFSQRDTEAVRRQQAKDRAKLEQLRREKNAKIEEVRQQGIQEKREAVAKEKAEKWRKVQETKDYYRDMQKRDQAKRTESAGVKKYRKQVAEKTAKLYELLMTNSDAKHVPQALKKPLAEFLESIDFSSKRLLEAEAGALAAQSIQRAGVDPRVVAEGGMASISQDAYTQADLKFGARLQALEQLLTNQQRALEGENVEPTDLGGYLDISEENLEYLREISQAVTKALSAGQTYTINQMSAQDLQNLSKLLSNIGKAIRGMNKFLANARFQSVQEAASRDIETMGQLGRARETDHGGVSRFLTWENGIPYYIFKRFGEGGRAIFDGFMRGWEKMAMNAKEIIDFTARTYKSEEVREWEKTIHDIELEDGSKIRMTTAQIMEFAMLLGREQALKHIEAGGIRIGDIETKKGKISDTAHYHLTANDIDTLLKTLTDRQMEVAKAMQAYMALRGAEWGNEVSMARFGYQFYEEGPGYYPIKTDSNDRPMADTDAQMNSMFRLLNLSASKTLNPKASNALVVGSIFDTFSEHMADMAKLNGMGLPILDAIKWFNYKERINRDDGTYDTRTLQAAMQEAYGEQAQKYFRTLMRDINGQTESGDRGMDAFGKAMSRYKIAAVGANLRVFLLQPTSYVRAQTVIKPKYLLAAFTSKNAYKEALEYSGTAVWKSLGYYDTDISKSMRSQIKHDETALDELTEKSMAPAEFGDQRTWGRLWVACKMQVKAERKLEGEALKKATADLFRDAIYSSQVMDGTLTRSEIMRSKGSQTKAASAFMAEPTLSYNILLDAASEFDLEARRSGKKIAWQKTRGKIGKAIITYVSSAAFSAIVESFVDAVRDEDDDKFLDKFLEAFLGDDKKLSYSGNLLSDLTLIGKLPFYKEFVSMIQGFQSGNMGFEGFSNALNAYRIWKETYQLATGELEKPTKLTNYGKMTPWGKVYKTLQALSQLSGIPAANLTRDVVAIWNNTAGAIDPAWKIRRYDNEKARNAENLMRALDSGNRAEIEAAKSVYADENDAISAAKSGVKEDFLNGAMTEEEAAKMLTMAGMDKNDAFFTVSGWATGDSSRYAASKRAAFAGDTAAYRDAMKDMTSHGYTEKQVQSEVKKLVRKVYFGEELSEEELEITGGAKLSDADARKILHNYAGLSVDDANNLVAEWNESRAFEKAHGAEYEKYDLTQSQAKYYYDTVKGSVGMEAYANQVNKYGMDVVKAYYGADGWKQTGLSVEVYSDYRTKASACKGTDADNDGKTDSGSVKAQVLLVIDALPVSASVKDAIYLKNGWAESGLKDAPWH